MIDGGAGVPTGPQPGLCGRCAFHREIRNRRGSVFHMCERSLKDPRFRKYPPLPVFRCPGFRMEGGPEENAPRDDGPGEGDGSDAAEPGAK